MQITVFFEISQGRSHLWHPKVAFAPTVNARLRPGSTLRNPPKQLICSHKVKKTRFPHLPTPMCGSGWCWGKLCEDNSWGNCPLKARGNVFGVKIQLPRCTSSLLRWDYKCVVVFCLQVHYVFFFCKISINALLKRDILSVDAELNV